MLTAMHDGMSTFFIVTTSDLIGQDSKTTEKLGFKWYYDQKITFIFSSDFETLFTKHTTCKILGLNFEKKTVYLNYNFPIQWSAIITPERIQ